MGDLERVAATWRIPDDAGRRYAKVSGDVNPIHLSGLTAKAFGFKRAIAHGMWVKARVLGALSGRLPDALSLDVSFRKPLLLPVDGDAVDRAGRRRLGLRRPQRHERHRARGRHDPPALSSNRTRLRARGNAALRRIGEGRTPPSARHRRAVPGREQSVDPATIAIGSGISGGTPYRNR